MPRPSHAMRAARAILADPRLAHLPEYQSAEVARAMIRELRDAQNSDPMNALVYGKSALEILFARRHEVERATFTCTVSEIWRRLGSLSKMVDRYVDSERFHGWALYWARRKPCSECEADCYRRIATLQIMQMNVQEAKRSAALSVEKYAEAGGTHLGRGYTAQGYVAIRSGDIREALVLYEKALKVISHQDRYFFTVAVDGYAHCALRLAEPDTLERASSLLRKCNSEIPAYYESIRIRLQLAEAFVRRKNGRLGNFFLQRKLLNLIKRMDRNKMERYIVYTVGDLADFVAATPEQYRDNIELVLLEVMDQLPAAIRKKYSLHLLRLRTSLHEVNPDEISAAAQALRAAHVSSKVDSLPGTVLEVSSRPVATSLEDGAERPSQSWKKTA